MSPLAMPIWAAVQLYRLLVSPWLPPACRFTPSCSAYALEALERHGALRGTWLAVRRLLRCHPWGGSGYDPIPQPRRGVGQMWRTGFERLKRVRD